MPKLIPIVEGYGEVSAVPILLRRRFKSIFQASRANISRIIAT